MTTSDAREAEAPPSVPQRPCQEGVPPTRALRDEIRGAVRAYADAHAFRPPLTFTELHDHSGHILEAAGIDESHRDWVGVLLNNATWREQVAAVPYDRRLLLLPQCLRDPATCPAEMDELGLLCQGCGQCVLAGLKADAEALGYVTLISEGTAAVVELVKSGKVAAFVGGSCMSTLEKVFPIVSMMAVPAIAIPLLYDGCERTGMDIDWLTEAIHLAAD
jgi:hypothetical protein